MEMSSFFNAAWLRIRPSIIHKGLTAMNKPTLGNHWLNNTNIMIALLAMSAFSLLITWGVELLAKELFRLG
ncbi:MAG: hypothetical protein WC762_01060 [Methylobacter sp.]